MTDRKARKERIVLLTRKWAEQAISIMNTSKPNENILDKLASNFLIFCKINGIKIPQDNTLCDQIIYGAESLIKEMINQKKEVL